MNKKIKTEAVDHLFQAILTLKSVQQSNSIITTQSEDAKNSFESNKFNNM